MKVAIIGSTKFVSYGLFKKRLRKFRFLYTKVSEVVVGDLGSFSKLVQRFSEENKLTFTILKSDELQEYVDRAIFLIEEDYEPWELIADFRNKGKRVDIVDVSETRITLESYRKQHLCVPGFEKILENRRKAGMADSPCPSPNYRLSLTKDGSFKEGGYFHYKDDVKEIAKILTEAGYVTEIEELVTRF